MIIYPITHRSQLRRDAARDRLIPIDRELQCRDAGQLERGDDVIIAGSVSDDEAKETYPDGWESPRPAHRIVPQPQ